MSFHSDGREFRSWELAAGFLTKQIQGLLKDELDPHRHHFLVPESTDEESDERLGASGGLRCVRSDRSSEVDCDSTTAESPWILSAIAFSGETVPAPRGALMIAVIGPDLASEAMISIVRLAGHEASSRRSVQ